MSFKFLILPVRCIVLVHFFLPRVLLTLQFYLLFPYVISVSSHHVFKPLVSPFLYIFQDFRYSSLFPMYVFISDFILTRFLHWTLQHICTSNIFSWILLISHTSQAHIIADLTIDLKTFPVIFLLISRSLNTPLLFFNSFTLIESCIYSIKLYLQI